MTLNEDLKIPSRQTFKKAVNNVIKKNPKLLRESVESYLDEWIPKNTWDRYEIEFDEYTGKMDPKRWDKFVNESYLQRKNMSIEEQWGSIAVSLGKADNLKTAIINELKKEGYNSMVDEAGVGGSGRSIEGADPLIIFDSSILKVDKVKEVTSKEEQKSQKKYKKWISKSRISSKNNW